jgi:hypothetical protein
MENERISELDAPLWAVTLDGHVEDGPMTHADAWRYITELVGNPSGGWTVIFAPAAHRILTEQTT